MRKGGPKLIVEQFKKSIEGFIGHMVEVVCYDGYIIKGVLLGIYGDYIAVHMNDAVLYFVVDKMQACVKNTKDFSKTKLTVYHLNKPQFTDVLRACKNQWVTINCFSNNPFTGLLNKIEEDYIVLIDDGKLIYTQTACISSFYDGIYEMSKTVTDDSEKMKRNEQQVQQKNKKNFEESAQCHNGKEQVEQPKEQPIQQSPEELKEQPTQQSSEELKEQPTQQSSEEPKEQPAQQSIELLKEQEIHQLTMLLHQQAMRQQHEVVTKQDIQPLREIVTAIDSQQSVKVQHQQPLKLNTPQFTEMVTQQPIVIQQQPSKLLRKYTNKKRDMQTPSPFHQTIHGHLMKHLENKKSAQQANDDTPQIESVQMEPKKMMKKPAVRQLPSLTEWMRKNTSNFTPQMNSRQHPIQDAQTNTAFVQFNIQKNSNNSPPIRKATPIKLINYNQYKKLLARKMSQRQTLVNGEIVPSEFSSTVHVQQQQQSLAVQYYALMQHAKKMSSMTDNYKDVATNQYVALMQHAEKMYKQLNSPLTNE